MRTTVFNPVKYVTPSYVEIKKAELNCFINNIKEKNKKKVVL